jgi:hypothetical protein
MEEVLTAASVNVMDENCDVTVAFEFEFSGLAADYVVVNEFDRPTGEKRRCVTGGTFVGTMKFDKYAREGISARIPPASGRITRCPDFKKALEKIEYRAAMVGLREGWVRWNPSVLIAALQHSDFNVNKAMAESLYGKSLLDDYTNEQKLQVYESFLVAASHNDGGLLSDTQIIIVTLDKLIEPEIIEDWDEDAWQEFLEGFEIP